MCDKSNTAERKKDMSASDNISAAQHPKAQKSGTVKKKTSKSMKNKDVNSTKTASKVVKNNAQKKVFQAEDGCISDSEPVNDVFYSASYKSASKIPNFNNDMRLNSPNNLRGAAKKESVSPSANITPQKSKKFINSVDKKEKSISSKVNRSEFSTPVHQSEPKSIKHDKSKLKNLKFEPYIPLFEVQQGLKRGEFIEGALRINPRNYEDAYVSSPDGQMDIYIGGIRDRNRALNGDLVVVQINPKQEWKVLCDAIRDYQERRGQPIIENKHSVSVPPTPCKVHTPEKFNRSKPGSSNSWDGTSGERYPDTLEILGVDKLAEQFNQLSVNHQKQNKRKGNRCKLQSKSSHSSDDSKHDLSSQASSSASHKLSADFPSHSPLETVPDSKNEFSNNINNDTKNGDQNLNNSYFSPNNTSKHTNLKQSENKLQNSISESNEKIDDPWLAKETSFSLIISPEQLLNFEDNNLEINKGIHINRESTSEESSSDIDGVVVPPDDLSGDAFTDSASSTGSLSNNVDQILEDAEFLASQQDAENNNVADDNISDILNVSTDVVYSCSRTVRTDSVTHECKIQERNAVLSSVSVASEAVNAPMCGIDVIENKERIDNYVNSESEEHLISSTVFTVNNLLVKNDLNNLDPTIPSEKKIKSKRGRRRNRKKKVQHKTEVTSPKSSHNDFDFKSVTVDEVMKHPLWPKFVQKTGKVVYILERNHSCIAAGHIKLMQDKNPYWALFSPIDNRLPRVTVPLQDCPPNFYQRPADYTKVLFIAEIKDWYENATFAYGRLIKALGNSGEIEPETEGILLEYGVDFDDFPPEVTRSLPRLGNWSIPDIEIKNRQDFRSQCIFTIDPATARDMDDAVSCELLENGNFLVGVHIADVTYFVHEGTALDNIAESRATSVYLVQKVIPMLPRILCDELCSLNPGKDRLTFSVVWEMTKDAEIVKQAFCRSVIKSCIKMSYEHAQDMIENPLREWSSNEHPPIYGPFSIFDISKRVAQLHSLALKLREKRFKEGALKLDQVKLEFTLDQETGLPSGFSVYEQKDSHRLIEEFMLLANMSVAEKIYTTYPDHALLRRHPPPSPKPLDDIISACSVMGIHLDGSSSGSLQSTIARYSGDDILSHARGLILTHLCSKPMNCALYFCSGVLQDIAQFHHYALNVPFYTHFTSPIRRYPDVIVHRLLGASLNVTPVSKLDPAKMQKCADHCNSKKYNAKRVSELSAELFLAAFIRESGVIEDKAMVVNVLDHSFDCLALTVGIVKRVYCDKLTLLKKDFKKIQGIPSLNLIWKHHSCADGLMQTIMMFSLVDIMLTVQPNSLQITATLKMPSY